MTSPTVTTAFPWPLWSCTRTPQPQRRSWYRPQPRVPAQRPYSLVRLQAQAEAQARSEAAALWEVMMRPA